MLFAIITLVNSLPNTEMIMPDGHACFLQGNLTHLYFTYSQYTNIVLEFKAQQNESIAFFSDSNEQVLCEVKQNILVKTDNRMILESKELRIVFNTLPRNMWLKSNMIYQFCVYPQQKMHKPLSKNKLRKCSHLHTFSPNANLNRMIGNKLNSFVYKTEYDVYIYGFIGGSPIDGRFILTSLMTYRGNASDNIITQKNTYIAMGVNQHRMQKLDLTLISASTINQKAIDWYCENLQSCDNDLALGGYESVTLLSKDVGRQHAFFQITRTLLSIDWYDTSMFLNNRRICILMGEMLDGHPQEQTLSSCFKVHAYRLLGIGLVLMAWL